MTGMPFGGGNGGEMRQVMKVLQEGGMQEMMLQPAIKNEQTGQEISQAALVADVINILRMDTKRMGQEFGVDISIKKMDEERCAELLAEIANGDGDGLLDVFDRIEEQRMKVLGELVDDDDLAEYMTRKQERLYSVTPETAGTLEDTDGEEEEEDE